MDTQIEVNGVKITLTPEQLKAIDTQVKDNERKNKPVTERINSYEDACADQNIDPFASLPFTSPCSLKQEQTNAFWKLATCADSLNVGQPKEKIRWVPYFDRSGGGFSFWRSRDGIWYADSFTTAAARLCVFDSKTSDHFGKGEGFKAIWELFTRKN